ncbi:UNVERIFIED_CONTAM: Tankyrase-1 [Trichonephila clavipes]
MFVYFNFIVLLQHGADPSIRNTDGKAALDLADPSARSVLTGEYRKDELLEAARSGNEEKLMALLTPINVNCHASDGRKVFFVLLTFITVLEMYVFSKLE